MHTINRLNISLAQQDRHAVSAERGVSGLVCGSQKVRGRRVGEKGKGLGEIRCDGETQYVTGRWGEKGQDEGEKKNYG